MGAYGKHSYRDTAAVLTKHRDAFADFLLVGAGADKPFEFSLAPTQRDNLHRQLLS